MQLENCFFQCWGLDSGKRMQIYFHPCFLDSHLVYVFSPLQEPTATRYLFYSLQLCWLLLSNYESSRRIQKYFSILPRAERVNSILGEYISSTGVESYYFDYLKINDYKPFPYHYFELWLNGMITFFSNDLAFNIFALVTQSFLIVLFYYGVVAVMESFIRVTFSW